MTKKTTGTFLKANEEYVKLRNGAMDEDQAPREVPKRQAPGLSGHDLPSLERWTTIELRSHALRLKLPGAAQLGRSELIQALVEQ